MYDKINSKLQKIIEKLCPQNQTVINDNNNTFSC